ncbi:MAG: hypothetical protein ACJASX_000391 [Limisphaerales bacterium]|jgi:hypothetical protein
MVDTWALDKEKGLYGEFFPLAMSKRAMKKFNTPVDHSFGYTPDTAYFTLDGIFRQRIEKAPELTLNHLDGISNSSVTNTPTSTPARSSSTSRDSPD